MPQPQVLDDPHVAQAINCLPEPPRFPKPLLQRSQQAFERVRRTTLCFLPNSEV